MGGCVWESGRGGGFGTALSSILAGIPRKPPDRGGARHSRNQRGQRKRRVLQVTVADHLCHCHASQQLCHHPPTAQWSPTSTIAPTSSSEPFRIRNILPTARCRTDPHPTLRERSPAALSRLTTCTNTRLSLHPQPPIQRGTGGERRERGRGCELQRYWSPSSARTCSGCAHWLRRQGACACHLADCCLHPCHTGVYVCMCVCVCV